MELIAIILAIALFGSGNKAKVKSGEYKVVGKGMNRKLKDKKTGMYIVT